MKTELLKVNGNDLDIVDVARVSYGKEASNYKEEQNIKLIKYLIINCGIKPTKLCLIHMMNKTMLLAYEKIKE